MAFMLRGYKTNKRLIIKQIVKRLWNKKINQKYFSTESQTVKLPPK